MLVFALLTIFFTLPSIFTFNTKMIGDSGDNNLLIVYHQIVFKKIIQFQNPFSHDNTLRFPVGVDFSRGFDTPLFALIGGFLRIFFSYIPAYNLALYISFIINGLCSYILFSHISKSKLLGVLGAVIFGFSFYSLARGAGHVGLATTGGFPLFLYSLIRIKEGGQLRHITLFAFSILLVSFATLQFSLFLLILVLINIPIIIFYRGEFGTYYQLYKFKKKELCLIFFGLCVVFISFFHPFISSLLNGSFMDGERQAIAINNNVHLIEYIVPNAFSTTLAAQIAHSNMPTTVENVVFIGWIELLFFGIYCLHKKTKYKFLIIYNVIVFFLLSLGNKNSELNIQLPYSYLFPHFPFYFIPEASRFVMFVSLFSTIGIIIYLSQFKKRIYLLTCILLLVSIERFSFYYYQSPPLNNVYTQIVKATKAKAVFDIPASFDNAEYDTLQISYDKKIVSGYIHWSVDTPEAQIFLRDPLVSRFICGDSSSTQTFNKENISLMKKMNEQLIEKLKKNSITTFVVHKNDREDHAKFYFPECENVRLQSSLLLPQLFMPKHTEGDVQKSMNIFFPATEGIGDTIYIPTDGKITITGLQVFPMNWKELTLYINGTEVKKFTRNAYIPPLALEVLKGQKISFKFGNEDRLSHPFIKLWYSYTGTPTSLDYTVNGITQTYEDEDAAVFIIKNNE